MGDGEEDATVLAATETAPEAGDETEEPVRHFVPFLPPIDSLSFFPCYRKMRKQLPEAARRKRRRISRPSSPTPRWESTPPRKKTRIPLPRMRRRRGIAAKTKRKKRDFRSEMSKVRHFVVLVKA